MKIYRANETDYLTFSRPEQALFGRPFRGKFRLARLYTHLTGLNRKPFRGVAEVPDGRFLVNTAELQDWGTLFGGFEERELIWIRKNLRGIRHAWDIGAHHGTYSIALARIVGRDGLVHAVEPFTPSLEILKDNLRLNGVEHLVQTHECAVADYVGETSLQLSAESGNHSLTAALAPDGRVVPVHVTTLDQLLEELGTPDFVKVDVERGERAVFNGAQNLLQLRQTIFLFESEPWDSGRAAVHAVLRDAGYHLSSLNRGRETADLRGRMVLARPKG